MAPGARKLTIDGYLAFYRIDADAIMIVRVVDQRRLLEAIGVDTD
jgi:plasmid stabilization system protein ParE